MQLERSISLLLSIINGGVCILGDYLVDINHHSSLIATAIFDNVTHATIGFLSAIILILQSNHRINRTEQYFLIAMDVLVSSLIDIDHFIIAKSLKLTVILIQFFIKHKRIIFMHANFFYISF